MKRYSPWAKISGLISSCMRNATAVILTYQNLFYSFGAKFAASCAFVDFMEWAVVLPRIWLCNLLSYFGWLKTPLGLVYGFRHLKAGFDILRNETFRCNNSTSLKYISGLNNCIGPIALGNTKIFEGNTYSSEMEEIASVSPSLGVVSFWYIYTTLAMW